ncbi:MAG TPA: AMP-binding protein [Candidatus Saccharimonadales bacterium]|jgi:long-chain acyl-CoA synthetase|nr:AMP-binding protein [Candidatus Saccharimonadales bacterium]
MIYQDFGDYVAGYSDYKDNLALTARPSLKILRLNYGELQAEAYRAAHYLLAQGITSGDRIMVIANNSPSWVELFLGTQLIGATLVPVDAGSTLKTALNFIQKTKPKIIFRNNYLHAELDNSHKTLILDTFGKSISGYPENKPAIQLDGEAEALIVFTSGTTADPKGVVLSQRNILSNITGIHQRINIGSDWRLLSVLPLSHMYELNGSLAVLSRGASIFYMPRVTPQAIAKALQDYQITTILAIPQLLILLLERIWQAAAEEGKSRILSMAFKLAGALPFPLRRLLFSSVHSRLGGHLNLVVTGGAPIPLKVASSWEKMGVRMVQGYGLTETSPILTVNGLEERKLESPGQPLDNVKLRISEAGEIQVKGPSIFSGYLRNHSATKAAFTDDGWFKTGDIGSLHSGWLYIQGRLKFAIVLSSGLKVFPEDIESLAGDNPVFKGICVVGLRQPKGETVLAVVTSDKSDKEIGQAISDINAQLESFQHIDGWERWPNSDFPRTRLLKIDHRQVQAWVNTHNQTYQKNKEEPAKVDSIKNIIRLSIDEPNASVKDYDQLADIGLDSLRRLNIIALIEDQLNVQVPEDKLTSSTTVAELRKLISNGSKAETPHQRPKWPYWRWVRFAGNGFRECLINLIVRIWVKTRVEGRSNLDNLDTPALFIFNHTDDFDGPIIYRALPYQIRKRSAVAAADDVLREHKILAFIIRFCFAGFNFARKEPYMPSLEYVSEMIDRGWNVVLAPEGRLSTTAELQPFKSGIGLLAVSLGVPVVAIKTFGLSGTVPLHAKWPKKRSQVTLRIAQPVIFDDNVTYDDATEKLQGIMENL